ncbi:hypothetical protein T09_4345 [Trichinella sp. T9]|nr:hypothetical protein T09_4345 [Trichinella sp. T9]
MQPFHFTHLHSTLSKLKCESGEVKVIGEHVSMELQK